ncbi:MAG: ABC transporter ATP-binding protein [Bacteriovoracia bacterium]
MSTHSTIVEVQNVSKSYISGKSTVQALKNVDLKIQKGAFMTITGPSGSGKSTLLNILGLLDRPDSGLILLNEKPFELTDFDQVADVRARTISFIFQAFNLIPVLSVEENVMVPLFVRNDISQKDKSARVEEWIHKVGLWNHRTHRPDELSGGQRQRVSIARAMVTYPELILADEPTANLDSKTAHSILELMQKLNEEKKTTFIFATHDHNVQVFAKQTIVLIDGQIQK